MNQSLAKSANSNRSPRPMRTALAGGFAILFGSVTLFSGGSVVLVDGPAREAAGAYIPFVVWFNFLAGFFYIIAGIGLLLWKKWAVQLSAIIAVATIAVFIFLGFYIMQGGAYELRTVAAMVLRSTIWSVIAVFTHRVWKSQQV